MYMYVCAYIYFYAYACLHDNLLQSHLTLRLWTVACQAPLSMAFSRQEYWSGLPCPPPENLPNPGIEPTSVCLLCCQAGSLPLVPPGKPLSLSLYIYIYIHTYICVCVYNLYLFIIHIFKICIKSFVLYTIIYTDQHSHFYNIGHMTGH